ncbi:MAG TPA: response regulator [Devosia sp.]|uniref:response regulator n=1 Tax=Devosia sp. TaxID=1871048 RepID=UPI002F91E7EE
MYVEDDPLVAFPIEMMLAEAGYEVTTVSNGPGALLELQRGRPLDLLLTDIRLPGNVDGWAIANKARELMPDLPVLYVSGDSAEEWAKKGVPSSAMLRKPFDFETALTAVRQALR